MKERKNMIYSSLLVRRGEKKRWKKNVGWDGSLSVRQGAPYNQGSLDAVVTGPEEEMDLERLLRLSGEHLAINL